MRCFCMTANTFLAYLHSIVCDVAQACQHHEVRNYVAEFAREHIARSDARPGQLPTLSLANSQRSDMGTRILSCHLSRNHHSAICVRFWSQINFHFAMLIFQFLLKCAQNCHKPYAVILYLCTLFQHYLVYGAVSINDVFITWLDTLCGRLHGTACIHLHLWLQHLVCVIGIFHYMK